LLGAGVFGRFSKVLIMLGYPHRQVAAPMPRVLWLSAGGVFWCHRLQEQRQNASSLKAAANLKVNQIAGWWNERMADAAAVMARLFSAKVIAQGLVHPQTKATEDFRACPKNIQGHSCYLSILLVAPQGKVRCD